MVIVPENIVGTLEEPTGSRQREKPAEFRMTASFAGIWSSEPPNTAEFMDGRSKMCWIVSEEITASAVSPRLVWTSDFRPQPPVEKALELCQAQTILP